VAPAVVLVKVLIESVGRIVGHFQFAGLADRFGGKSGRKGGDPIVFFIVV
jgi:hypothetical protein